MEDSEYIDVLNYGISETTFKKIGFSKLDFSSDNIIIPNFFNHLFKKILKLSSHI